MKYFYLFWGTQFFSTLGSSMSGYALSLWVYAQTGSAFAMSLLSMASTLPNLFAAAAGPLADKPHRKRMIMFCDLLAGAGTLMLLGMTSAAKMPVLLICMVCFVQSLFNTFQAPAADAAITTLISPDEFQKTAGIRSLGYAVNAFLAPAAGGAIYLTLGLSWVLILDLVSCLFAVIVLWLWIPIPETRLHAHASASWLEMWKSGTAWLKQHPLVLAMMLYLGFVNLVNAIYQTAMPVMVLNRSFGGPGLLSVMRSSGGAVMCLAAAGMLFSKSTKNPVKVITLCILISFASENFILAFASQGWMYIAAECIGWASIPIMNTYLDVFYRRSIPVGLQGRIFAVRNTISYSFIPLGSLLGGALLEKVIEPQFAHPAHWMSVLFGNGKGGAAAFLLFGIGCMGAAVSAAAYICMNRMYNKSLQARQKAGSKTMC